LPPASHTYGAHETSPLAAQLPAPSHDLPLCLPAAQVVSAAHAVPEGAYCLHLPAPSHASAPDAPKLQANVEGAAHSSSGSAPSLMAPQVPSTPLPFLAAVHAEQTPVHAESQHTPSAQNPEVHSFASVQGPLLFFAVHVPDAQ
jgi:hypothetical protein